MDTGYYVNKSNNYIYGPTHGGQFYIKGNLIHGPQQDGLFWLDQSGVVWGPDNSGQFRIVNGHIYGPTTNLPWLGE